MGSEEACRAATELAKRLWQSSGPERQLARRHIERYHGASLLPDNWQFAFQLRTDLPLVWNMTRSFVGTVTARVGATSSPKVQFVTSNANWATRRKAQKLDQFIDGLALQAAPPYASIHELRTALLRDCCLFRKGVAQVHADVEVSKVITERVLPWELLYDSHDARYGCPSEVARAYPISRHALKGRFPERADEIDSAMSESVTNIETELGITAVPNFVIRDSVQIWEVWIVADGPESPGRHIMILEGSAEALIDEEYDGETPPFVVMYWDHPIIGGWNQSLADECAPFEDEINRSMLRMSDAARRTALNVLFFQKDTIDEDTLNDTKDSVNIPFEGQVPPVWQQAEPINASMVEWVKLQLEVAHDITGISEQASTGSREPGLPSAEAQRAVTANQTQRLAWLWKQVENWQISWAKLVISGVRKIAKENKDFLVKWPGKGFLKSIPWRDADLDEDQYFVQIYAVGELKNTPADRLQRAEEAYTKGVISLQTYQAITYGTQDFDAETREQSIQRELINSYIEQWLDATEEQIAQANATGWLDEEKGIKLVPPPIKWLNLNDAILQVALAYLEAELQGAPDANRQLFTDWLEMADSLLQEQLARQQALQVSMKGLSPQQTSQAAQQAAA